MYDCVHGAAWTQGGQGRFPRLSAANPLEILLAVTSTSLQSNHFGQSCIFRVSSEELDALDRCRCAPYYLGDTSPPIIRHRRPSLVDTAYFLWLSFFLSFSLPFQYKHGLAAWAADAAGSVITLTCRAARCCDGAAMGCY